MLGNLRRFRLEAKKLARDADSRSDKDHYNALQQTFKVLINSFYGYLGFAQAHFADFTAASEVTAKGREIITDMMNWLKEHGATLIELDTDGIYFVPPGQGAEKLEEDIQKILPAGITVEFDERYRSMFSYKAKNYALLKEDGSVIIKGASLKSRGLEKFQRTFMEETIRCLLENRPSDVRKLLDDYRECLVSKKWSVETFAKNESLQDSLSKYQEKIAAGGRNRAAVYELAIQSGRNLQPGDSISYYITGTTKKVKAFEAAKLASEWDPQNRDENVEYYLAKLDELYKKFEPFLAPSTPKEPELF